VERKFNRNYSFGVVAFIAIPFLLIAAAVLAQTSGAGQTTGQANALMAQAGTTPLAQTQRPLIPWTDGSGRLPASRPQTIRRSAGPMATVPPSFVPAVAYDSRGSAASSVAVGDLNGDGKPDLVVANASSGTVAVFLGNGDGTFQAAVTYAGGDANGLVIADVNGDGKPDIVVANGGVGVLLGNGDGTFQPVVNYSAGGDSNSVAVADVNRDGKLDIVATIWCSDQYCDGTVSVLLGDGDGTFQPAVTYSSGGAYGESVAVADVNGDGKPDLLVANLGLDTGEVGVLLGNGDGTFQPAVSYSWSGRADSLAVADVNGDGKLDLLLGDWGKATLGVMLGNGDGTFQAAVTYPTGSSGAIGTRIVAVADVNGDGKPDLLVTTQCGNNNCDNHGTVGVLLGNGDGTFQPGVNFDSGGYGASGIAVADVNGDGLPDLVLANNCSSWQTCGDSSGAPDGTVGVLLNNVGAPPTTTTLVSSLNPAAPGKVVTYTASVTSQEGGTVTGWVTFADKGSTVATLPLANDQAAYSTKYITGGSRPITAAYLGDLHNARSTSATLMEYIEIAGSKTVVATSGSPSLINQPVTFTATVTSTHGTIPGGELVTFYDGATAIGTGATASGAATFTTSSLTVKPHTIKATYAGDDTFVASSGSVEQLVDKYLTTAILTSSLNPSNYGQAVALTATVTSTGPYQPTGTITFKNGSAWLGSGTLNAGGVATLTTAKIPVGVNTLTSTYSGNAFDGTSVSAAIILTVSQASVSMRLTSTPNPSTFGKSVKFTAKLTSNGGLPTGQPVTFSYNGATLGTANVNSTGVATFSTITLPRGTDVVTAAYSGSVYYSSASASVTQVVN